MASVSRDPSLTVMDRLVHEPWKCNFFALVLWLERLHRTKNPRIPPVGTAINPQREFVRFHTYQQQSFAASDIAKLQPRENNHSIEGWDLFVNMLGLTGPNGVLPSPYLQSAYLQDQAAQRMIDPEERSEASALPDFYNIFDHRQIALFYRAWAKYRLSAIYAQTADELSPVDDAITNVFYSLVGFATGPRGGQQAQRSCHLFPDETVLYYAGIFSKWPRSALSLKNMLAEYYRIAVEVREFQPHWVELNPEDQSRMASALLPDGQNAALGQTVMIGSKICRYGSRFRLRIGPLSRSEFDSLLPESRRYRSLVEFVMLYVGSEYTFDIQLVLRASDTPGSQLGGPTGMQTQLSRNSWLLGKPAVQDRDDVVLIASQTFAVGV